MLREDTYALYVTVDGAPITTASWDKMEGGEIDSEDLTYRPGGLTDQIALGGSRTIGNVTVKKIYDASVHGRFHDLSQRVGRAPMVVIRQPLDADGNANVRPITYSGVLKQVTPPDVDSEGNDAAIIELEMTCRGSIT